MLSSSDDYDSHSRMVEWFYSWLRPEFDRMPGVNKLSNTLVLALRRVLIAIGFRPEWQERFGDRRIWIKFDDNFSIHRRLFPRYGQNLTAVARVGRRRDQEFRMIDVGASFGDGIATILEKVRLPILAIEPSKTFAQLQRNFGSEPEVEMINAFLADGSPPVAGSVPTLGLANILEQFPAFAQAGLIKVDTDGHDFSILRQNEVWLRRAQPIVFFEYDPHWPGEDGRESSGIFSFLAGLGYERALVYDLTGLFMLELELKAARSWEQLTGYLRGPSRISYLDICAFPVGRSEWADDVIAEESGTRR